MAFSESFRAARWIRTLNLVLQAVLFLTFFAGLNYVARNHPMRFDLTRHRKFSLSPETLSYIKSLPRPVDVTVTVSEEHDTRDVRGLLDEYVTASATNPAGQITVRYIDVYQDRRKAEELGIEQPNVILLRAGDKPRAVPISDLYRYKDGQRHAFQGEQVLTAALLEVTNPVRQKIYFLVGHGELQPGDTDPRGLSALRDELRVRNFLVDGLDLTAAKKIPADASLLVAAWPQTKYTAVEQELLRQHLSVNAGRLILCLGPGQSASQLGLDDLLFDWGILADNAVVIDPSPEAIAENNDLLLWAFETTHPIMQTLVSLKLPLRFGPSRTIRVDPGRTNAGGLSVVPIAGTTTNAWGETAYTRPPYTRDDGDIRPMRGIPPSDRLSVAVASERVSVRDNLPFTVRGGRLVVFGSGDFVANQRIANVGNMSCFLNTVNWTVDRDPQLAVPARPVERFQLALSAAEFMQLRYALVLGLPGATLLLGLMVYWTRRR